MGLLSRAGDLVYTLRFLRLLTTPFDKTTAFELGLIDEKGKKLKKPETKDEKGAYNTFHRLVFNIKKLIPCKKIGSYAAALYLMKEKYGVNNFDKILRESNIDPLDLLAENNEWFMLEQKQLSPGVYRVNGDKVLNKNCEELVKTRDQVRIPENCYPVGDVLGLDIYEVTHLKSMQNIYVTAGELIR
jgi:hypothetical protein